MSALTSLLVRDRVVPVSKIEQALHAQVFQGGDIEIILLEMDVVAEDVLSAYRAALFDLLPGTRDEVMKATRDALRRVPAELARSLGIVPIFFEGRTLVVAAWEPLYEPRLSELEAQLGCDVNVRIVNQARLAAALAHHYGFELDPRLRRLSDALRRRHPGVVPYVRPPAQSLRPLRRDVDEDAAEEGEERVPAVLVPGSPPTAPELAYAQFADEAVAARAPAASTAEAHAEPAHDEPAHDESESMIDAEAALASVAVADASVAKESAWRVESLAEADLAAPIELLAPAQPAAREPSEQPTNEDEAVELPSGVSPQLAAILRDPLDLDRAVELLQVTSKRDDVLFVLMRYVQHAFDFVCLFSVGKPGASDSVRARMAHGAGIPREGVEHVSLPLPRYGAFADAIRERRPVLGEFGASPEEAAAARALHRERERVGLWVPITLNDRVVLVVYAERVRAGLGLGEAAIVLALVPAVVASLRRLILQSKADRQRESQPMPDLSEPLLLERPVEEPTLELVTRASQPESVVAPEPVVAEPAPEHEPSELHAVDLDAFEQLAHADAAREAPARPSERSRELREKRQSLPGVPRPAPPPPAYEAPVPVHNNNGYRSRGGAGLAQERAASSPQVVAQPVPQVQAVAQPIESASPVEAARHGLSLVEPTAEMPSVIIDMGESVDALIEGLLRAPVGSDPPQVEELLMIGEGVLPVLAQHFPGPLWFDRKQPHKRRPRGSDVSAVARALAAFGERAAPYLASVLASGDPERTYYALMVASEIVHPDLIDPVARRVLDKDEGLRLLALEVLRHYAVLPQYDVVLRAIADLTERPGKDPRRQRLAVEALGELRDSRVLRTLIARLSDRDENVSRAAHHALVVLTGQDFGGQPRRWETWAEGWGRAHRVEWLIESLLHGDEAVRTLAGEELKLLTQQYFGYHPALPRKDRELAQRKYREWWELEGRLAFAR